MEGVLKIEGKVVPVLLFLTEQHAMGEWRYSSRHSLDSALDGDE
jgi:hypothetical protein